ncbi:MAG: hypothetical protein E7358_06085, partial [Clostridiales bacterium]|nr:hypothetical protein [Clostridiales bacterium]
MNKKPNLAFKIVDAIYISFIIIPIICLIVLKVLFTPASEGISISGALIYFTIPMPIQDLPITESQVNSLAVIIIITSLCLYLTHGIRKGVKTKRQHLAEMAVEFADGLIKNNMGDFFKG